MKRVPIPPNVLLLGLFLFGVVQSAFSQNDPQYVLDSVYLESYDPVEASWAPNNRTYYPEYNDDGRFLQRLQQNWDADLAEYVNRFWYFYEYDPEGLLSVLTSQKWKDAMMVWENNTRSTYTRDAQGFPEQVQLETWDELTMEWVEAELQSFLNEYDGQDRLIRVTDQKWDGVEFVNVRRTTYTYDIDLIVEVLLEVWSTDQWIGFERHQNSFDQDGVQQMQLRQRWDSDLSVWYDHRRLAYTYDAITGNQIGTVLQKWDAGAAEWVDLQRITYYWSEVVSTATLEPSVLPECLLPNPIEAGQYIQCTGLESANRYRWELVDGLGRVTAGDRMPVDGALELPPTGKGWHVFVLLDGHRSVFRRPLWIY
ncbi:MAG: hypothetical protein KDC30_19120 [Saprospiraceae bacterium]|nr:hypothetical protein [Saprospiraceae bacterium]